MKTKLLKHDGFKAFINNNWLMLLIVLQPVLDIVAFWTKNPDVTLAGYVRLLIMIGLPVYLFFTMKEKKERIHFALAMFIIALVCGLHIFNTIRVGAVELGFDISYTAKTAQMPILAVCFMFSIKNDQIRNQAYWGLFFAAAIMALSIGLSVITGTANVTYGEGLGISGWVIEDNRCANSTIVVVLAAFAVFCAVKSDKKLVNIAVPALAALVLGVNGTMTCYLSIFLIHLGFAAFLPLEKKIRGCRVNRTALITLIAVSILSAAAYPLTPKYKISISQNEEAAEVQESFFDVLERKGYDIENMSHEEKLAIPDVKAAYEQYYYDCLWYKSPNMFERFSIDEILLKYDMTTDGDTLINTRLIKSTYAALMWDHSDTLTKLFGIDISDIWYNGKCDLENDWPAIYYYFGYVGIAAYAVFMMYFAFLIVKRLFKDLKSAFTADNFILLICFVLLIGIAQYSGAVLRRPNVSFYLSLVLGLLHYQTVVRPINRNDGWRGEWI